MLSKTTSIELSKAIHKRFEFDQADLKIREDPEEQPETVRNDPVPLAKELVYLLTSGLFITQLRCRLPDTSLDMLVFKSKYFSALRQNAKPKMSTAHSL